MYSSKVLMVYCKEYGWRTIYCLLIGLSTFEKNPGAASDYIKPLLKYAAAHIPSEHHADTQLFILATAGMRMIPKE